jgi:large subunit ribosomal protein L29
MKAPEIRTMGPAEVQAKLEELNDSLVNLKMQHATKQLDNPNKLKEVRRDIARLLTVVPEQERAAHTKPKSEGEPK